LYIEKFLLLKLDKNKRKSSCFAGGARILDVYSIKKVLEIKFFCSDRKRICQDQKEKNQLWQGKKGEGEKIKGKK
jgi:hypothetical protein